MTTTITILALVSFITAVAIEDWKLGVATALGVIGKAIFDWRVHSEKTRSTAAQKNLDTLIDGFKSLAQEALDEAGAARKEVKEMRAELAKVRTELEKCNAAREHLAAENDGLTTIADNLRAQIESLGGTP